MEIALVRNRLRQTMDAARARAEERRRLSADAERAYAVFLRDVATPVTRQLQNALKAEGLAFTVFTPERELRLSADRGRDDFVAIALDTAGERPEVVGRVTYTRGSRTMDDERPIKAGVPPEQLTEEDVLEFLLQALAPWLAR